MRKKEKKGKKEENNKVLLEFQIVLNVVFKERSVEIDAEGTMPLSSPFSKMTDCIKKELVPVIHEVGREVSVVHHSFKKENFVNPDAEKIH